MANVLFNLESSNLSGINVSIFPDGSDSILVSGILLSEQPNRKGIYSYTNTTVTGLNRFLIYNSGNNRIGQGWANLYTGAGEIDVVSSKEIAANSVDIKSIGGSTTRLNTFSSSLDNNLFARIFDNTVYISGKTYNPILDEYISGVVSTIVSYSNIYDSYISGKADIAEDFNNYISGVTSQIISYNEAVDNYISGRLNNLSVNISGWLGLKPEPLAGAGLIRSSLTAVNGNTTRATTFGNALDGQYFARILLNSEYISGSLKDFDYSIDNYNSGLLEKNDLYNIWLSGIILSTKDIIENIENLDNYLSGRINQTIDSNIISWRGNTPGNLDSNGFVPSNTASINGNIARAATFSNALDYNLIEKTFNNTAYISGNVYSSTLDKYISGVVDSIVSYSNLYDIYISGQSDKIYLLDNYISGISEQIQSYNNSLDLYLSGKTDEIDQKQNSLLNLSIYNSGYSNDLMSLITSYNNSISSKLDDIGLFNIWYSGLINVLSSDISNIYDVDQYISGITDSIYSSVYYISGNTTYNPVYDQYISGQIQKNINIYPLNAVVPPRIIGTDIYYFVGEQKEVTLSIVDSDEDPVDLTGKDLSFIIDYLGGCDKYTLSGTIADNKFAFTNPPFFDIAQYKWALRDSNGNEVLAKGKIIIEDAAYVDN